MVFGENLLYVSKGLKLWIEIIEGDFLIIRSYALVFE